MTEKLHSWGRHPNAPQTAQPCTWRADVPVCLKRLVELHGNTLPFGNGRSYGDSCLAASDHVLNLRTLDRFMATDWQRGVITAEAGVTLAEILTLAIPRGWFLAITPGTQFVTLGGAIANDVHGKNHHVRGTFGTHVLRLGLQRHNEPPMCCSSQENATLFNATIGGLGLTGVITWAEIQLMPIRSSQIDTSVVRFESLAEFFILSDELDHQHEYSVAWIDCLARGKRTGRGVFMLGDHAPYGSLKIDERRKLSVPLTPPLSLINHLSLRAFNEIYWRIHPRALGRQRISYEPFFYPLDRILHWNRIYGRKGFQQYQCVIPEAVAQPALHELLNSIASSGQGSFLAVLKRCGNIASPGLLSFPLAGSSLALDFPQKAELGSLFARLDAIVHEAGGRLYPAKDAHMAAEDFRRAYPAWEKLETLRDPAMNSRFWTRVTA
ncbi:FAD-binding oxidoreductase [Pseudomonas sp. AN-1]|uniref:FAD-binding oxidoreductase n=1 Tax=Pseudomonas sp. AN-1 TaxID=3096605 RepID=UPI002A6A696F|nr:FAD-binding oxidoreductase [Pseudomonas sp. AN-1]WPP45349.1 FAD-binding oxidoreductase [Pseudomonas sp. AN-1]